MNEITIEKLDLICARTGLSYKEAQILLEKNSGDVLKTIIFWEENKPSKEEQLGAALSFLKSLLKMGINKAVPSVGVGIKKVKPYNKQITQYLRDKYKNLKLLKKVLDCKSNARKQLDNSLEKIKNLISQGKVSSIRIKHNNKILREVPIASWRTGTALAVAVIVPELAIIALVANFFKIIEIEIIKKDGKSELVSINNKEDNE